ncbi:beta-ketoacyl-[acyl-carrier-protein] synthase family protein [Longispora albida]|uniref:beta-ketoacyl-[acyl-carrier-protein] synthase family protein n=1 Tax=Longispora albida TaxID=203523 RepID=UPI00037372AB|nr:beta-ketoacyl-[acyl-carrier-protein] synthase family protein [Longispora albida]
MSTPAAITGLGMVTPVGTKPAEVFDAVVAGHSGLARPAGALAGLPDGRGGALIEVVGACPPIDPLDVLPPKAGAAVDRFILFALLAAEAALADAGLVIGENADPERVAVLVATSNGGMATYEEQALLFHDRGRAAVSPYLLPGIMPNQPAARIAIRFGVRGYTSGIVSACAGGGQAIGEALRLIRAGEADVVLCGGTDAPLAAATIAGFSNAGALARGWSSPSEASRPFDSRRNGFVLAEGAGMLVIESTAHAQARKAKTHSLVLGWGATTDAHHPTMPRPDGAGAAACMRKALADAGLTPADIGYINAHGTSTKLGDAAEATAIRAVFGETTPPVSSTKGVTGHLLAASGAVEAGITALALSTGTLPPTHNLTTPDCPLTHITSPWSLGSPYALSNSFAFGGHNVSLVLGQAPTREART